MSKDEEDPECNHHPHPPLGRWGRHVLDIVDIDIVVKEAAYEIASLAPPGKEYLALQSYFDEFLSGFKILLEDEEIGEKVENLLSAYFLAKAVKYRSTIRDQIIANHTPPQDDEADDDVTLVSPEDLDDLIQKIMKAGLN